MPKITEIVKAWDLYKKECKRAGLDPVDFWCDLSPSMQNYWLDLTKESS